MSEGFALVQRMGVRIQVARSIDWEGSAMDDWNVLIYGDSRSYSLRHEVPLPFPDPVAYLEVGGKRWVLAGAVDIPRLTSLGAQAGFDVVSFEDLGLGDAMRAGRPLSEAIVETLVEACRRFAVSAVRTPADFPVGAADQLRAAGVDVRPDGAGFDLRRRRKTPQELAGIRRGIRAAEAAMVEIRDSLRRADDATVEELRGAAQAAVIRHGAVPHDMTIIAPGPQGADQHDQGSGVIARNVPIVVDIFPRDLESGCWGDLTRTLCVGEPPEELVAWHQQVREAQCRATEAVRPGISGAELNQIAMDCLAEHGHPTRHGGVEVEDGFAHYLGHGLGLDLHEAPTLDEGGEVLIPGDVVTIEPGLYRRDFGGCRIEDVVFVTEDGYELLTDCPYDLVV
jgi:Xaa-Pro aminopeptidase